MEERMASRQWPDLTGVLEGLRWAVAGDVAIRAYGPERHTRDLDVVILKRDSLQARNRLKASGHELVQELAIGGSVWRDADGEMIDVIELDAPWSEDALGDLGRDAQGLPVLSLPYLTLMKVASGRTQDLADVSRMMGLASEADRARVASLFSTWMPEALEDLKALIELGVLEWGSES